MVIDFEINCFLELITCSLVTTYLILHWKQFFFDQINQLLFAQHFEGVKYHVNAGLLLLLLLQSMIYQDHIPLCKTYLTAVQFPLATQSKWLSFLSFPYFQRILGCAGGFSIRRFLSYNTQQPPHCAEKTQEGDRPKLLLPIITCYCLN